MRGDGYTLHANSVHPQNQDQKIYFLSFYQNSIYGIIIIKSRFTISRQRKLEEHNLFYDSYKWCKFYKWSKNFIRYIRAC